MHVVSSSLRRPMWTEFPQDKETFGMEDQFMCVLCVLPLCAAFNAVVLSSLVCMSVCVTCSLVTALFPSVHARASFPCFFCRSADFVPFRSLPDVAWSVGCIAQAGRRAADQAGGQGRPVQHQRLPAGHAGTEPHSRFSRILSCLRGCWPSVSPVLVCCPYAACLSPGLPSPRSSLTVHLASSPAVV